jgi:hypothetical protein
MALIRSTHDLRETGPAALPDVPAYSRYCYLFPELAADPAAGRFAGTDDAGTVERLKEFEAAARLPAFPPPARLMDLPAAYTYFGQFLNHDLSAPAGGLPEDAATLPPDGIIGPADPPGVARGYRADPATILAHLLNQQGAPLSLGSVYADGPDSADAEVAALYEADGKRFRLGTTIRAEPGEFTDLGIDPASVVHATGAPDLPRQGGVARIADRRNDGNLILGQLHLAFLLIHNRAVALLEKDIPDPAACFRAARQLVTRHYHWLVLHDFLPRILSRRVLDRPLAEWQPRLTERAVPMEFTSAAFRFGHSMVGRRYDFNANFGRGGRIAPDGATLIELFAFTSHGGMGRRDGTGGALPDHWVIDWDRLTTATPSTEGVDGRAERIDLNFAPDMLNVAAEAQVPEHGSILFRNLLRGFHRRIPFGQRLADACGVPRLTLAELRAAMPQHLSPGDTDPTPAAAAERLGLLHETPAWLYLLCEADVLEDGQRVGPTASQIIADTIVGLLRLDPQSPLGGQAASWHPADSPLQTPDGAPLTTLAAFLDCATKG